MKRRVVKLWSVVVACAVLVSAVAAAAAPAGAQAKASTPAIAARVPKDSVYQLPLPLTDQHGVTRDWRRHRGAPQIAAMFYTSCPDMCPLIVDAGKAVEHALTPAERSRLGLLYISLDPVRDTPATLAALAKKRGLDPAHWALASPRENDVRSVAGILGVRYRQLADGQFNHTSALVLIDGEGRIVARTERMGSQVDPRFLAAVRGLLATR
ncbi:SCO family protein [Cognatiluteimonas telluris]|jgi:protein SCO1/2|uniref:SCO family protein n=1 Tax=Cognatiluteimonas telluris TaxID=1104775 RepID=UPI00140B7BF8|nr:SCO family protein [Lysobacter telluris]